jgi:hypothetical protein
LRNKLLENIEKSLAFYHFKYKDSIHAYYDIQLSIMFRERGGYALSFYFLKKAEKKAKELDQFNILEQIYQEYTQLALKDIEIDIEEILTRRRANLEKVKIQRRNTEAVAIITQQLKKSNFSREKASVIGLLEKTLKSIEESAEIFQSSEAKIQVFRVVSALLLQKEAYAQLVQYISATIKEFESANLFNADNHSDRLLMRLWLLNSLIKCSRFLEAEAQSEIFKKEMAMHHKQNYFAYLFNYINSNINVAKSLGKIKEADTLISEGLASKELCAVPEQELYLMCSLADQQFLLRQYPKALATIQAVRKLQGYRQVDEELRLYIEVFEMVLQLECKNSQIMPDRFSEIKKAYRQILKSEKHEATLLFMELLVKIGAALDRGKQPNISKLVSQLGTMVKEDDHGANSIINYNIYAQAKAADNDYYTLFLEHMQKLTQ